MFHIGIDSEEVSRFESLDEQLLQKIFTYREIEYCKDKSPQSHHLAGKFCAKESIIKAFFNYDIQLSLLDIEIINTEKGMPQVIIPEYIHKEYSVQISISHNNSVAVACALVMESQFLKALEESCWK
ncbi:MAG: 4'-phosphopantetheinyl transferase superfamily protein [Methanospirillaceae archaeon]|nr:4'-phosphopantetheinyl transferase superfamily protein [Methanospirillaceae archaeon]